MGRVTNKHRLWLMNVQNAIDMSVPFDYVDITARRIDILFDKDLVTYGDPLKSEPTYILSELGKTELEKYIVFRKAKTNLKQLTNE